MSTSQLSVRRKISDALYGQILECELRLPNLANRFCRMLPIGTRLAVAVKCVDLADVAAMQTRYAGQTLDDPQQECRVAELLVASAGHPNVVQPYFTFQEHGSLYLVSEYCADGDLHSHIAATDTQRLGECESTGIMKQILSGVDYLHRELGIAHRDLSLENVLMHDGEFKVADFGLSVAVNSHCTDRVGKKYYMAPEVVAGEAYDPVKADVWSLGVIWFVMLTGSPLVQIASRQNEAFLALEKHGVAAVLKSWGFAARLSPSVLDLLSRMLQVDPERRISLEVAQQNPCFVSL